MRVAILHDHLRFIGGGERLVLTLASALDADLYVTDLDPDLPARIGKSGARVHELAAVPTTPIIRQERQAAGFREADLPGYDAYVLSGNWAVFAAARHRPNLWYCHTPVRVFYDLRESFLRGLPFPARWAARNWIKRARPKYEAAVSKVQHIVANSRNVAGRVARFLHRSADVVYPPVDTAKYRFDRVDDFWLSVSRLSHEKRLGLLAEAFRGLPGERLVVAGGPQMGVDASRFIRSLRPPDTMEFLGEVDESRLLDLYATCRGLIATAQDEDFGLTPVEAMASGKAVIAVDEGGYRESVVHGETGWLVPARADAIRDAIRGATKDRLEAMRSACRSRAEVFDQRVFVNRMREMLERVYEARADGGQPASF